MQDSSEGPGTPGASSNLGKTLSEEHAQLEQLFEDVLSAFEADARVEAQRDWNRFDSALRAHMALEEEQILPRLAQVNAPEAEALRREHEHLRAQLLRLGIGVDLHLTRDAQVLDFIRELRAHAKREDALMYRFAQQP